MSTPINQAAWLDNANSPLVIREAPMPSVGPNEIIVKNHAVAINPLDNHMQDIGVFVQQWPAILGCDVAGEVFEVGSGVDRFKKGDRVIGHSINLVSGRPQDGAFALYTTVRADKAAVLPDMISFTDGVVVPFVLEAAVCTLCLKVPSEAMPGVQTPALGLPYPALDTPASSTCKVLLVYGGSSAVGSMTTQLATAAGIDVIAISGAHNFEFVKNCGAVQVFDRNDGGLVEKVVKAIKQSDSQFIGIFDAVSTPDTYAHDLAVLAQLNGGHLACVHPPPSSETIPANVSAGMIFAVSDIAAPVFRDFVTPALENGKLKCLPRPTVVGKGLASIRDGLNKMKAGVSATKLVVEL